jgi:CRISPR-associated RAMP protein (TIGR02581 family)
MPDTSIYAFDIMRNRLVVTGELVALTALRIGAGRTSEVLDNDLPVLRDALRRPFIPGASLKGAFRSRIEGLLRATAPAHGPRSFGQLAALSEKIARARDAHGERLAATLRARLEPAEAARRLAEAEQEYAATLDTLLDEVTPDGAALDFDDIERRTAAVRAFVDDNADLSDAYVSTLIWRQSTPVDLLFGSPQVAGRLFFKDALVDETLWFDQFEVRNGVALNRDTETAEDRLLYDYEVVPAGTRFHFEMALENAAGWQLGLALLALQPWQRGDARIGGFRSRGLGYVRLENVQRRFAEVRHTDDVLRMLCDAPTLEALGIDPAADTVDDDRARGWYRELRQELERIAGTGSAGGTADA